MEHSQENHMKALNELCRCCGNLNFTAKQKKIGSYPSLVCDRVGDILSIFDICVADDEEGKHSRYVCYTCVSKIRRAKSNSVGAVKSARLSKNREGRRVRFGIQGRAYILGMADGGERALSSICTSGFAFPSLIFLGQPAGEAAPLA